MWRALALILACVAAVRGAPATDCPQICPMHYQPVCDSEGRMHGNDCQLRAAMCEPGSNVRLTMCTMEYDPVCGNNGRTYSNQCHLGGDQCLGVEKESDGPCPARRERKRSLNSCDWACTADYQPVCGTDGKLYSNSCMLQLKACETDFKVGPIACPRHLWPVCGSDGRIYGNHCMLRAEACKGVTEIEMENCQGANQQH